jgi:hypothetical protein
MEMSVADLVQQTNSASELKRAVGSVNLIAIGINHGGDYLHSSYNLTWL